MVSVPEGFLNVCKEPGFTSQDVVAIVRRLVPGRRVGHAGTLDPAAAGVLPVAVGRATRLADLAGAGRKTYFGVARLGAVTDTDDAEGQVIATTPLPADLSAAAVEAALRRFVGAIEQVPPAYSARKVSGRRAYDLARAGRPVGLAARRVTVYALRLLSWEPPDASFVVHCSRGTYVRALARDLGQALGVGGHLARLVRLAVGPFRIEAARTIAELRAAAAAGRLDAELLPPDVVLLDAPALIARPERAQDLAAGRQWRATVESAPAGPVRAYLADGTFAGLVERVGGRWQPRLAFGRG